MLRTFLSFQVPGLQTQPMGSRPMASGLTLVPFLVISWTMKGRHSFNFICLLIKFCFCPYYAACGILVPKPGIESLSPVLEV